jgi:hypothetical protein
LFFAFLYYDTGDKFRLQLEQDRESKAWLDFFSLVSKMFFFSKSI